MGGSPVNDVLEASRESVELARSVEANMLVILCKDKRAMTQTDTRTLLDTVNAQNQQIKHITHSPVLRD